jgi:hypothetical protein
VLTTKSEYDTSPLLKRKSTPPTARFELCQPSGAFQDADAPRNNLLNRGSTFDVLNPNSEIEKRERRPGRCFARRAENPGAVEKVPDSQTG